MKNLKLMWVLFAVFAACAWSQDGKAKPTVASPDFEKVKYKKVGDSALHLHIRKPRDHKPTDSRPAVVFFFGGGWMGGSPDQFVPHARHLADAHGFVAVCAEYRTRKSHGTSPYECVKDGKSAVRWLRAHAAELGIDPDRLAAGGGSAGGHVAATTGVCPGGDEAGEDLSVSSVPNALLLFNPVYDNGPEGYGHGRLGERWREVSPLHNIREGAPPTIVFLGTKDKLIPVATAEAYEAAMKKAGSVCVTHLYEGQPHGFFNYGRGDNTNYNRTIEQLDAFLERINWIQER